MKLKITTQPILSAAILSIAMMSASMIASADNHKNGKPGKGNQHKEYRVDREDHAWKGSRHERKNENRRDENDYRYERDYHAHGDYRNDYYEHPKYGRVYQRFDRKPLVFRHSCGEYYYLNNRFYTYHDRIGYCVAEPPRNVYFSELPFRCTRIYANGREYYRNGDLFFRLSARGYILVPAPLEVNVSVSF